uniref:Secreted protein n=1 Tax=Anopheles minimus TaxID=112268 RepID=A0A182WAK5_9DIPT
MNAISIVLVLMLFGTVCSSYAIDCLDVWDEESIAEMIEEDRRYQEALKAGHVHDEDDDDDDDGDDEDDEHAIDSEDETQADSHEEDEEEDEHAHEHHETNVKHSPQDHRHKRETPMAVQSIAGEAVNEEPSDLETAETHLFRPVFRYKSQYTERRRVRTPNGGVNFAPTQ